MFEFLKKKKVNKEGSNGVSSLAKGDIILKSYQEKAQEEIQYLIDFICRNGDGSEEFGDHVFRYVIKTGFEEDGEVEHMWVQVDDFKDGYFIGRLANEPGTIKSIKYADPVSVFRDDVEDWILDDFLTGTKVGGFSQNYLKNSEKSDES